MEALIRKVRIEMVILVNTDTPNLSREALLIGIQDSFNPENTQMELTSGHEYSVLEYKAKEIED